MGQLQNLLRNGEIILLMKLICNFKLTRKISITKKYEMGLDLVMCTLV